MSGFFRRNRPVAADTENTKAEIEVPAGTDLDRLVGERPVTQRRGRLRRRLRHLRSVREILFRDLGGLVFEVRRTGGDPGGPEHRALLDEKLTRMGAVDTEIRELEAYLDDRRGMVVREPGIGGTCTVCGELFGSDARFCWACGTPVAPGAVRPPSVTRALAAEQAGALPAAALAVPYVDGTTSDDAAAAPPPAPPAGEAAATRPMNTPPPPPPPPAAPEEAPTRVQDGG